MKQYREAGYFEKRRLLKSANFLKLTPVRRHEFRVEEDGMVTVMVPKFSGWLSSKILQPFVRHPYIYLSLDEAGSATWHLCDGNRNVETICLALKQTLGEKVHPTEDRVTTFLSRLYKDKIITFREIIRQ